MISCRDWWPCYITMTRRQSNNQWSGSLAAHPAPKNSECKNPMEKFSPASSFRIKTASSLLIIFQRTKLSTRSISHPCRCNWWTFWRKNANAAEGHPVSLVFKRQCLPANWHMQPWRNWPTGTSNVSITHTILQIWSRRITTYSLHWKTTERSLGFFRRVSNSCQEDLVGRTKFWIFLSGFQGLEQEAKKCIELHEEYDV